MFFYHQIHAQVSIVSTLAQLSFWSYFSTLPQQHIGHLLNLGAHLLVSCFSAFSYCSRGSPGKNAGVVCHTFLQWTTFCQNCPSWLVCFMDVDAVTSGGESKVRGYKEQCWIGSWNLRATNQGRLDVVKQEMASVNVDILGISELRWTGMGEFDSDYHYIYYCGQKSLRRNGVAIMVNKRVRNAVYLDAISKTTERPLLISKANHSISQ